LTRAFRAKLVVLANITIMCRHVRAGMIDQKDGVGGGFNGCGDQQ
jgi:hypothetical protein